ncbi:hypothetical protein OROHE_020539 [Orobanche hederae]
MSLSYIYTISENLKNSIPKAVVYCQVKEAEQNLLLHPNWEERG